MGQRPLHTQMTGQSDQVFAPLEAFASETRGSSIFLAFCSPPPAMCGPVRPSHEAINLCRELARPPPLLLHVAHIDHERDASPPDITTPCSLVLHKADSKLCKCLDTGCFVNMLLVVFLLIDLLNDWMALI